MPNTDAQPDRWTIDFYDVDSGRMVGRVAYAGGALEVDRVHSLIVGMNAGEIYTRYADWSDGETRAGFAYPAETSTDLYVRSQDGATSFVVKFVGEHAPTEDGSPAPSAHGHDWDIEEQIQQWEEDPVGFTDTYGYVPTDDLPESDPRHGMRIVVDGFDDDYNALDDDAIDEQDAERVSVPDHALGAVAKVPATAPDVGGRYRTNTLIPQEYDPSIGPDVLVEVVLNHSIGGSDVRVIETGQVFFCPWGNLVAAGD